MIQNAFLKFSLTSSLKDNKLEIDADNYRNLLEILKGMEYEIDLYRVIKQYIINTGICDSFVEMIAYSKNCTKEEMSEAFSVINNIPINDKKERMKYLSHLTKTLTTDGYPVISYNDIIRNPIYNFENEYLLREQSDSADINYRYCYLITESMSGSKQLEKSINERNNNFLEWNGRTISFYPELYNVLFQIVYACNILDMFKISHNDLHTGNLYVRSHPNPFSRSYSINGKEYIITSKYEILLYDFDRSYMTSLGDNENLFGIVTRVCSQTNEFIKGKNLLKVFLAIFAIAHEQYNYYSATMGNWLNTPECRGFLKLIFKTDVRDTSGEIYKMLSKGFNIYGLLGTDTQALSLEPGEPPKIVPKGIDNSFCIRNMYDFNETIDNIYKVIIDNDMKNNIARTNIVKRFVLPDLQTVENYLEIITNSIGNERITKTEPVEYEEIRRLKPVFQTDKQELKNAIETNKKIEQYIPIVQNEVEQYESVIKLIIKSIKKLVKSDELTESPFAKISLEILKKDLLRRKSNLESISITK